MVRLRGLSDIGYTDTVLDHKGRSTGRVSGYIDLLSLSKFHQLLYKVELKPYYRYMCIMIEKSINTIAADITGYSDVFIAVNLDGARQMTRVTFKNLNQISNLYLYIPIRMGGSSISKRRLQKNGNIIFSCFDYDDAGNDFLRSIEIPLSKIDSVVDENNSPSIQN
ncbi:MAG: hypothetical protein EZS28_021092 [Streblomastix strix]|uniref:C2 domain-containing protein n=1 Tax=Streblomastix strix TaxID=222440 RepID=A0A5J4VM07_9EUKA|nr:MAG: hypothetical protein EZS28_021092 [Streblomastix strix]